jgi:hypothetical protein
VCHHHRTMRVTRTTLVCVVVAGLLSASCGRETQLAFETGGTGPTATTGPTAATGPTTTRPAATTGPTASTGPTQTTGATETVTKTETETKSMEPDEEDGPSGLPPPVTPSHGKEFYGVYLAAAPFGAKELDEAVRRLDLLGVEAFPGDINCDEGAAEQLDLPNDVAVVAVYFDRRRDARAWLDGLEPRPLGIARVRTFCLD